MTTAKELSEFIGRVGRVRDLSRDLWYDVNVIDAKHAYVPRVLVAPVVGSGCAWINVDKVTFHDAIGGAGA